MVRSGYGFFPVMRPDFQTLVFGVVFVVFWHWFTFVFVLTDRWWALTALDGVSRLFSQRSWPWVVLTDLGDMVGAPC